MKPSTIAVGSQPTNGRRASAGTSPSRAAELRSLLRSPELEFAMSAHDGISARIVEGAGFPAIWASGLSISTVMGARDNNEISWTQLVDAIEVMADMTSIPIIVDGDTGFGDFNNARRLARKLGQVGAAGVCMEDKVFPKANSFVGAHHQLANIEDFCAKLRACRDANDDIVLIARVEAFICGESLEVALERAEAYRQAGADGVFIHSRLTVPDEIIAFAERWENALPVVIAPTTYAGGGTQVFRDAGLSVAIWANHTLRAAVAAMRRAAHAIRQDQGTARIDDELTPLSELFELMDYDELFRAEELYYGHAR
jgi:phosphoenolpyruvate phosphomutase